MHSGACFIRTDQLDDETDWKLRIAIPVTQKMATNDGLLGHGACPHSQLHRLNTNLHSNRPTYIYTYIVSINT